MSNQRAEHSGRRSDTPASSRGWWTAALVTIVNALTSAGFSVAGLIETLGSGTAASAVSAAQIFALYAAARSVPLAVAALWLGHVRSRRALGALAYIMSAIQGCDAVIGIVQHDIGKSVGPAVFAIATLFAARFLLREAASAIR